MFTPAIEFTINYAGRLPMHVKSALYNYLEFPTADNWDDIHGIIISTGINDTVWNAVLAIDKTFPSRVSASSDGTNVWERIPTAELVQKAIANMVFFKSLDKRMN